MKLLLISIHLVFCFILSFSSNSHKVTQTADAAVSEGEMGNISCCLTETFQRGRVYWFKNGRQFAQQVFKQEKCFFVSENFTSQSSDIYTCNVSVEIPALTNVEGNVTIFRVKATEEQRDIATPVEQEHPSRKLPDFVIPALAVVLSLILIATVCLCWLQKSKGNTSELIYEVPHGDSEGTEMDKHSTSSSRGSSQWCQVPLYESLAYFEHGENKQSQ